MNYRRKKVYNIVLVQDKDKHYQPNELLTDKELERALKNRDRYGMKGFLTKKVKVYADSVHTVWGVRYGEIAEFPNEGDYYYLTLHRLDDFDVSNGNKYLNLVISRDFKTWARCMEGYRFVRVQELGGNKYGLYLEEDYLQAKNGECLQVCITINVDNLNGEVFINAGEIDYYSQYWEKKYTTAQFSFLRLAS